eukprot:8361672-Pyramimonas_sp.AAC.1
MAAAAHRPRAETTPKPSTPPSAKRSPANGMLARRALPPFLAARSAAGGGVARRRSGASARGQS